MHSRIATRRDSPSSSNLSSSKLKTSLLTLKQRSVTESPTRLLRCSDESRLMEASYSQDASTSEWDPSVALLFDYRNHNTDRIISDRQDVVENNINRPFDTYYSSIPALLFSSVINFTKKFRRKTAANFSSFVRATFRTTQTIKRRTKNVGFVASSVTHRFLKPSVKRRNHHILIYAKNLFIQRLIRRNYYLIKWILIIFLYSIFMITPTSTESLSHVKFNDDERRLIRKLFLKKFGLEQLNERINADEHLRTRKRAFREIPDYIWDSYYDAEFDAVYHHFPSNTSEPERSRSEGIYRYNQTYKFEIKPQEHVINFVKMELRVSMIVAQNQCNSNIYSVNRTTCGSVKLYDQRRNKFLGSKSIVRDKKWISFDIPFHTFDNDINVIELTLEYEGVSNITHNVHLDQSLVLFFDDEFDTSITIDNDGSNIGGQHGNRVKRSNSKAHRRRKHRKHTLPVDANECKRTSLYVNFGELNWQDWIMAPVGYEAYQCRGRCTHPMPSHLNTTNHAIVQSLMNSIDPSAAPPPTCVPVEMSAISILYRDINNVVVVKTYPDMRVEACGCH